MPLLRKHLEPEHLFLLIKREILPFVFRREEKNARMATCKRGQFWFGSKMFESDFFANKKCLRKEKEFLYCLKINIFSNNGDRENNKIM